MIALWLTLATAHADVLRATLALDEDGAVRVVRAERADGQRAGTPGDVAILGPDGAVLATTGLPPFATTRDVPLPGGGGEVGYAPTRYLRVELPWPEGAASLRVGGRIVSPVLLTAPPPPPPPGEAPTPVLTNGPSGRRLDLVFLGDGFTEADRPVFEARVDAIVDHLLGLDPFSAYGGLFNVWSVFTPAGSSGVAELPSDPADSPFGCAYGCGGIDRLICCDEPTVVDFIDTHAPFADGVMVLVNSDKYGGSGGFTYGASYIGDTQFVQVAAHELAHSLIGLWDEYTYTGQTGAADAFVSPNCVHQDRDDLWPAWNGTRTSGQTVGRSPGCSFEDWDRPTPSACMMNVLQDAWCPVCREAIVRTIYTALGGEMIVSQSPDPAETVVLEEGAKVTFKVRSLGPEDGVDITWTSGDGVVGTGPELVLSACDDVNGELTATVHDGTDRVRSDPDHALSDSVTWTVRTRCGRCGCASDGLTPAPWLAALALAVLRRRKT